MTALGDALRALRTVLLMQEDMRAMKETAALQAEALSELSRGYSALRDRVSRLEGFIEGATAATRAPRIEGQS